MAGENCEEINAAQLTGRIRQEIVNFQQPSLDKKHLDLNEELSCFEKDIITKVLDANEWNQSETARKLDIPEQTLRYKMKKLGIFNKNKHFVE
jgi:DNA-binding NtrC family response regulator